MVTSSNWTTGILTGLVLIVAVFLLVWWRQQTFHWPVLLVVCLALAPVLSWWSGNVFQVPDYRAGCDGLCLGHSGAPIAIYTGESAGNQFLPARFALNTSIYLVILLAWTGIVRALLRRSAELSTGRRHKWVQPAIGAALLLAPFGLAPLYLPVPEAQVRGDSLRVAINARREVYLYDEYAGLPVLRAGLQDARPRRDGQSGLRVCLRIYTYFYLPVGSMYLDMTPEGVHSNGGGVLPVGKSCWQ